jgi:hypothetical protein
VVSAFSLSFSFFFPLLSKSFLVAAVGRDMADVEERHSVAESLSTELTQVYVRKATTGASFLVLVHTYLTSLQPAEAILMGQDAGYHSDMARASLGTSFFLFFFHMFDRRTSVRGR